MKPKKEPNLSYWRICYTGNLRLRFTSLHSLDLLLQLEDLMENNAIYPSNGTQISVKRYAARETIN